MRDQKHPWIEPWKRRSPISHPSSTYPTADRVSATHYSVSTMVGEQIGILTLLSVFLLLTFLTFGWRITEDQCESVFTSYFDYLAHALKHAQPGILLYTVTLVSMSSGKQWVIRPPIFGVLMLWGWVGLSCRGRATTITTSQWPQAEA